MSRFTKYIALLGCMLFPFVGMSQVQSTETIENVYQEDFELWTSVSFYDKLGGGFRLLAEQGFRFSDNGLSLSTTYTDLGVRYKVNDFIKVVPTYRFIIKPDELRHRLQFDLSAKAPRINRFNFSYRTRIQRLFTPSRRESFWRHKVGVSYDIKDDPITPFAAAELFYGFHYTGNSVQRMRYTFGASLNLPKGQELSVAYRFERQMNTVGPWQAHILSLNYKFKLKVF